MLARRLLILLAVVMGFTALAAGLSPRQPAVERDGGATPAPSLREPPAEPLERTIQASGHDQRIVVRTGQVVHIVVEADALDTVSLEDFGDEPVEPEAPARFELLADVPGTYAISLLEAGREIGTLEIREAEEGPGAPEPSEAAPGDADVA